MEIFLWILLFECSLFNLSNLELILIRNIVFKMHSFSLRCTLYLIKYMWIISSIVGFYKILDSFSIFGVYSGNIQYFDEIISRVWVNRTLIVQRAKILDTFWSSAMINNVSFNHEHQTVKVFKALTVWLMDCWDHSFALSGLFFKYFGYFKSCLAIESWGRLIKEKNSWISNQLHSNWSPLSLTTR